MYEPIVCHPEDKKKSRIVVYLTRADKVVAIEAVAMFSSAVFTGRRENRGNPITNIMGW